MLSQEHGLVYNAFEAIADPIAYPYAASMSDVGGRPFVIRRYWPWCMSFPVGLGATNIIQRFVEKHEKTVIDPRSGRDVIGFRGRLVHCPT